MKKIWQEARLSDKILAGLLLLVVTGWSATAIHANLTNNNEQVQAPEVIQEPDMITVVEAREAAIGLIGGGEVSELNLNTDEALPVFEIMLQHEEEVFQIRLNATNGELIQLENLTPAATDTVNPSGNLTSEEAIDIARRHLQSIGITNATLLYSYSDIENGVAVWSIEFRYNGRDLEFYVVKATGDFLKYPTASSNNSSGNAGTVSTPAPAPAQAPSANANRSSTTQTATESISREQAGQIALGITPGRLVQVDRDWENGRAAWWVEIRHEGMVHEFYIDMQTGAVIQHEIERDD